MTNGRACINKKPWIKTRTQPPASVARAPTANANGKTD